MVEIEIQKIGKMALKVVDPLKRKWERGIYMGVDSTNPEAVKRHRPKFHHVQSLANFVVRHSSASEHHRETVRLFLGLLARIKISTKHAAIKTPSAPYNAAERFGIRSGVSP